MEALEADLLGGPILGWPVLLARLAGAILLGGLIGAEREARHHPAGLRTHILVALAAAVYTLIMTELVDRAQDLPEIARTDPIRIVEAVTGGVAFLAAGLIIFTDDRVRGLTTGAGLWMSGAVGVAAGLGLWPLAALSTGLALIVLGLLGALQRVAAARYGSDAADAETGERPNEGGPNEGGPNGGGPGGDGPGDRARTRRASGQR